MKYFHEETDEVLNALIEEGITYAEIRERYSQPDWCTYPEALSVLGCWTLTSLTLRKRISLEYCKDCPYCHENKS